MTSIPINPLPFPVPIPPPTYPLPIPCSTNIHPPPTLRPTVSSLPLTPRPSMYLLIVKGTYIYLTHPVFSSK